MRLNLAFSFAYLRPFMGRKLKIVTWLTAFTRVKFAFILCMEAPYDKRLYIP